VSGVCCALSSFAVLSARGCGVTSRRLFVRARSPGLSLGVMACRITRIPDRLFTVAATALAAQVEPEDLAVGCVYPPLPKIREVSARIAAAVCEEVPAMLLMSLLMSLSMIAGDDR
jgi:hypothetical protein